MRRYANYLSPSASREAKRKEEQIASPDEHRDNNIKSASGWDSSQPLVLYTPA